MAEATKNIQDTDAGGGDDSIQPGSQNEFDQEFQKALNEGDASTVDGDKKDGDDASDGDTGKKDAGTGDEPPATPDAAKDGDATAQQDALTESDQTFLRSLGLENELVTPAELGRLKRIHGNFDKQIKAAESKATFFGGEAKKVSEKYQAIKKAYKEIMGQQTPSDRVKGIISKLDKAKLSPEAQELLNDPAYLEANTALLSLFLPKETAIPGLEDDEEAVAADAGRSSDGKAAAAPAATAQPPAVTEQQAKENIQKTINSVTDALKGKHDDIAEIYGSDDFRKWTDTLSDYEVAKIFSADPRAHDEVLTRYKTERAAKAAQAEVAIKAKAGSDALRTHQSSSSASRGKSQGNEESPDQILNDDATFDEITKRINSARVRTG